MTDWASIGGNPVPVQIAPIRGCSRQLLNSADGLRRWRARVSCLIDRAGPDPMLVQAGSRLVGQSFSWETRLHHAADALLEFATALDRLGSEARMLAGAAGSCQGELRALAIAEWYDLRYGFSPPPLAASRARALSDTLASVQAGLDRLRSDYVRCRDQVVHRIVQLAGAG